MKINEVDAPENFDTWWEKVENECGQILGLMAKHQELLYRGFKSAKPPIFKSFPRDDREPRDTGAKYQSWVDETLFDMRFGAMRSNSIFVTRNRMKANKYGSIYLIFPTDDFIYTWFRDSLDLFVSMSDLFDTKRYQKSKNREKYFKNWFKNKIKPTNKDIDEWFQEEFRMHELMIRGEYFAFEDNFRSEIAGKIQGAYDRNGLGWG